VHVFSASNANKMGIATICYVNRDEGVITCFPDRITCLANRNVIHLISSMTGPGEPRNYEVISPNIFHSILISRTFSPHKIIHVCCGLLVCGAVWSCTWLPTFRRNVSPPSSGLRQFLPDVGNHVAALQPRPSQSM
jgi:hypothetical protein